jgi:hypothetical protein
MGDRSQRKGSIRKRIRKERCGTRVSSAFHGLTISTGDRERATLGGDGVEEYVLHKLSIGARRK